MFTGLVEEVGTMLRIERTQHGAHIHIRAHIVMQESRLGDSISVDGVCLTVVNMSDTGFVADAVPETLRRSTLGTKSPGDPVNLERAVRPTDRLGGHIVSGHVDGLGTIVRVVREGIAQVITVMAPPEVLRYVVEKGSVCVDGVSLTVMDVADEAFRISIIPHTASHTTLETVREGRQCNLECDVLAKYVERLLQGSTAPRSQRSGMSLAWLADHGFA